MTATAFTLDIGATWLGDGRTRFRVWAPERRTVEVALEASGSLRLWPLERAANGYFEGVHPARPGDRYKLRLDGGDAFPDPAARFLPDGPHGPAEIVDPHAFRWTDAAWGGLSPRGQVLYELHVGAYTKEGTFTALLPQLPLLRDLGITCVELMPVNTFPGRFNWGYDGVGLYAPCARYGRPDDLRRLVDEAHRLGLGIILDVVYNHLGPDGNYLSQLSPRYFSKKHRTDWGDPPDFEEPGSRHFFVENAACWIAEYHLDGLRIDATQDLRDDSRRHVLAELCARARQVSGHRRLWMVAENEPQDLAVVTQESRGGMGCDAVWVDDFHHSAKVAVAGGSEGYCQDYLGTSNELLACALRNSLYQGQWYAWQRKRRGTPLWKAPPERAVFFLQNHDQVANGLGGRRLHHVAGERRARALTVYLLLLPQTPMLFMGQEFFASSPFDFFADHGGSLAEAVRRGRAIFLSQFPTARRAIENEGYVPSAGEEAFLRSRLDLGERERNGGALALHRELLKLRREDPVFSGRMDGAALGPQALALRFSVETEAEAAGQDRLVLLNLGPTLRLDPCPEPLLALPAGRRWRLLLSSEEARFGGLGASFPTGEEPPFLVPGQAAVVLASEEVSS
ncbi:MAG TPA: alpha-amylase family glycosyl hydrolase [Myxococcaceae bacterium]